MLSALRHVALVTLTATAATAGAHAGTTLPSVPGSAYPYYQTLKHYTFDNGASPDTQGWSTHDLTMQHGTFWRVAFFPDFAGKSMWCGVQPGELTDPVIQYAPGYGDVWLQILETNLLPITPFDDLLFGGVMSMDLQPGDRLDIEYRTAASGPWTNLESYTGSSYGPSSFQSPVFPGPASVIQFRVVLSSDLTGSDESGPNTNGAVAFDEIGVYQPVTLTPIYVDTFESSSVGDTTTPLFHAVVPSPFGNYAGLVSGAGVVQNGTANTSHVWSFFNGSSATYACGGHPSQAAVPKTSSPGSTRPGDYLCNEVRSPFIDLSVDQNSQPVDVSMNAVAMEFDVYADLPLPGNGVRYTYRYRFMVDGAVQEWHADETLRYSNTAQWVHETVFLQGGAPIPDGATHVQVSLVALDSAYISGATGHCHSQSPLFDNVEVHRLYAPVIVTNTNPNGPGSLYEAITAANSDPGFNSVLFDIAGAGPHTIQQSSQLPTITSPIWIDGFSQTGSSANLYGFPFNTAVIKIGVDGTTGGGGDIGLSFASTGYGQLRGISIGGFDEGIRTEATSFIVTGCNLGTDATGTVAVPNGIGINALSVASIGGPANSERMHICASQSDGVRVAAGNVIIFNSHFGFDVLGYEMANGTADVHVFGGTSCQIGQQHVTPCGFPYTDRVRVGIAGIVVEPGASGVTVAQAAMNYPYIDLGFDGPTANDPLDADTGANDLQNFPVLASADGTTILGDMDGLPNQLHRIEFFALSPYETKYLGYQEVTTDGSGHADISFTCDPIPPATVLTATATAGFNTSELAAFITSMNTPPGSPLVFLRDSANILRANVNFDDVLIGGNTFIAPGSPPAPPPSWDVGPTPQYWDITTDAGYDGSVQVTLHYDPNLIPAPESMLRLLHYDNGSWIDITTTVDHDGNTIGGVTNSLSPFVLAVPTGATGVDDASTPKSFALHANVPNPFNPVTTIAYDVPSGGAEVMIAVFDVRGGLVRTLVSGQRAPGHYTAHWDGADRRGAPAASGVYFYRMTAGAFAETRKMILLK